MEGDFLRHDGFLQRVGRHVLDDTCQDVFCCIGIGFIILIKGLQRLRADVFRTDVHPTGIILVDIKWRTVFLYGFLR